VIRTLRLAVLIGGILVSVALLSCQHSPTRQILELDSREKAGVVDEACKVPSIFQHSGMRLKDTELIIFDNGDAHYHTTEGKSCATGSVQTVPDPRWGFRWPNSAEQTFQGKLDRSGLKKLEKLLNRDDIKNLKGYANASPFPVGDFQVVVARPEGQQKIGVIGFQPAFSWAENPPLTDLICEAKTIAQGLSKTDSLPKWCQVRPQN